MPVPLYLAPPNTFPSGVPTPSYNSDEKHKPRVLKAQFGDGYSQRAFDGINNDLPSWSLTWKNLLESESDTITTFLANQGGVVAFNWTPPRADSAVLVTCDDWDKTWTDAGIVTLTATFQLVPDLQ